MLINKYDDTIKVHVLFMLHIRCKLTSGMVLDRPRAHISCVTGPVCSFK